MSDFASCPTPRCMTGVALFALVLLILGLISPPAGADAAYRWKDAEGRIHFSDKPPPGGGAEAIQLKKTPTIQAQPVTPEPEPSPDDATPSGTIIVDTEQPKPRKEMNCQERWAEYYRSQECFAPYQRVNAGPRAEAFEKCTNVPSPEAECPAPKVIPQ